MSDSTHKRINSWTPSYEAPENIPVETAVLKGTVINRIRVLTRRGGGWWYSDGSFCVDPPTHYNIWSIRA